MQASRTETEIKLRFDSYDEALRRLRDAGATSAGSREFEDNVLYDTAQAELRASGRLLRVRRIGGRSILTLKTPAEGRGPYKVRGEVETRVDDADAIVQVLEALGLRRVYRYQKHRTPYRAHGLRIAVDETPLGCFVELEGAPAEIDRFAGRLGFSREEYILATYRGLQEQASPGAPPGDLLLEPVEDGDDGSA